MIMELVSILKSEDLDEIEVRTFWRTVRVARRSRPVSMSGESVVSAQASEVPAIDGIKPTAGPSPETVQKPPPPDTPELPRTEPDEGLEEILSPMVGTFYTSPTPESDAFVTTGQHVEKGQVICVIEAMKLMNEIEAEKSGTIRKILVSNSQPVEFGQPLFLIESA